MAFWDKNEPVILERGSGAATQLTALESLRGTLPPKANARLEHDIKALKAGIAGEERILFELENSHMDMFVLQDLFLEHNGLTAQVDFSSSPCSASSCSSARTSTATSRSTAVASSSATWAGVARASTRP